MKIAFDIGGVLSKFPGHFSPIVRQLGERYEIHVITDMHDREEVARQLRVNGFSPPINLENVHIADYAAHGEAAKAVILRERVIDVLVDDFPGYLVWPWPTPAPLRLQVMPDPRRPYWHRTWDSGTESDFGRMVFMEDQVKEGGIG